MWRNADTGHNYLTIPKKPTNFSNLSQRSQCRCNVGTQLIEAQWAIHLVNNSRKHCNFPTIPTARHFSKHAPSHNTIYSINTRQQFPTAAGSNAGSGLGQLLPISSANVWLNTRLKSSDAQRQANKRYCTVTYQACMSTPHHWTQMTTKNYLSRTMMSWSCSD